MSANTGKSVRMNRIFDRTDTCIIFAGCHQMTSREIYPGQYDVVKACDLAMEGGATCINIGKGMIKRVLPVLRPHVAVLNYLPVYPAYSQKNPYEMIVTSTVEEATAWCFPWTSIPRWPETPCARLPTMCANATNTAWS